MASWQQFEDRSRTLQFGDLESLGIFVKNMDVIHFNMVFLLATVIGSPESSKVQKILSYLCSKRWWAKRRCSRIDKKLWKCPLAHWIWDMNILVYRFGCTFWIWSNLDLLGTRFECSANAFKHFSKLKWCWSFWKHEALCVKTNHCSTSTSQGGENPCTKQQNPCIGTNDLGVDPTLSHF